MAPATTSQIELPLVPPDRAPTRMEFLLARKAVTRIGAERIALRDELEDVQERLALILPVANWAGITYHQLGELTGFSRARIAQLVAEARLVLTERVDDPILCDPSLCGDEDGPGA